MFYFLYTENGFPLQQVTALTTLEYWTHCYLGFLYLLPTWTLFHNSTVYFFIKHLRILGVTSGFLPEGTYSERKCTFWYGIPGAMD